MNVMRVISWMLLSPVICWVRGHKWHRWSVSRTDMICERCSLLRGP